MSQCWFAGFPDSWIALTILWSLISLTLMSVVTFLYLCLKWWGHQMKTKHQTHQTHSTKLNLEISCVISSTKLNYPGGKGCSHIDIKSFWLVVCFSSVQKAKVYGWNSMYPREGGYGNSCRSLWMSAEAKEQTLTEWKITWMYSGKKKWLGQKLCSGSWFWASP